MSQAEATVSLDVQSLFLSSNSFGPREIAQLQDAIAEDQGVLRDVKMAITDLEKRPEPSPATKVRLGVGCYILGRYSDAVTYLAKADGSAMARFYLAKSYLARESYQEAFDAFDAAQKAGYQAGPTKIGQAECLRKMKKPEDALALLNGLSGEITRTSPFLAEKASVMADLREDPEEVLLLFEQAVDTDPECPSALFGLAMMRDSAGEDDEAIDLYERAARKFPPHLGTLLNLGVLYEDREQHHRAADCYRRILKAFPNDQRAKLYLKDAEASFNMVVDEAAESRSNRLSQILATPVTDFELSVRSRNCLEKMGVRTLGDLTRFTEQDLLASKNFGETSLNEIRQMLSDKDLRLGMAAEVKRPAAQTFEGGPPPSTDDAELLSKSVNELQLSVRAKKCMSRLGIATVGELVRCTADDLLECKNFGVTSLNEVREKLTIMGIKLRGE